ncbi:hypothetical protein MFLO_10588 [Listeria floridensis FSL S10-1187]|uniref:Nucleoid-associated protein n=1 Tax=Listeria floridensis FSL S10-1187 TaxID=1265817 RepID=A0ABP3AWN1_9LIST|nr:nucleoid-associated protein [Listeria floridensis]EUJ30265.1 hypothetical protein MFLO_10588 [Listeria floridensis FSL S10-1187]
MELTYAKLKQLAVHFVGNKAQEEGYEVSQNVLTEFSEELSQTLLSIFLDSFTKEEFFQFVHESDLNLNEVFTYSQNIFADDTHFLADSESILKHLYSESTHPNIKSGDLWIFEIEGIVADGEMCNALGIFKVENKEIYVKNNFDGQKFAVSYDKGITGTDLDKGCIILNTSAETGGKVLVLSRLSKNDSIYWKDRFLGVEKIADDSFLTENFVNICTDYIKQKEESLMEKSHFVKATSEYLQEEENLSIDTFAEKTLADPRQQAEFKTVVENYEQEHNIRFPEEFELDEEQAEKLSKKVRKTLKLGKNITLTVKDLENLDENDFVQGFDNDRGRNFMIVYYDE